MTRPSGPRLCSQVSRHVERSPEILQQGAAYERLERVLRERARGTVPPRERCSSRVHSMRVRHRVRFDHSPRDGALAHGSLDMKSNSSPPWILAGWLLAQAISQPNIYSTLPARIGAETPRQELLERGSVRELTTIKGLGARRAQSLVVTRSLHGALPALEDIPGIGPKTAATLRSYGSQELGVSGVAEAWRQGLSATHSGQGAAEATRAEALELREELRRDPCERPAGGRGRIVEE